MLKALLWKEWCEQRSRAALACVWLLGLAGIGLKTRIVPDGDLLTGIEGFTALILPAFLGMGLLASERKNGTLPYLMAQPFNRGQIMTAKVIAGLLSYAVPMVVYGLVICLTVGGREVSSAELAGSVGEATALGLILFTWQFLVGLRCRREETYILASAIVVGGWILHAAAVGDWQLANRLGFWIWAMNPLILMDMSLSQLQGRIWTVATMQSLILVGLAFGLWFRFRRLWEGRA